MPGFIARIYHSFHFTHPSRKSSLQSTTSLQIDTVYQQGEVVRSPHRRPAGEAGFVQVLPLILFVLFASAIFVIVNQVQRNNQDVRSRAANEAGTGGGVGDLYPPTTTTTTPAATTTQAPNSVCDSIPNEAAKAACKAGTTVTVTTTQAPTNTKATTPAAPRACSSCAVGDYDCRVSCVSAPVAVTTTAPRACSSCAVGDYDCRVSCASAPATTTPNAATKAPTAATTTAPVKTATPPVAAATKAPTAAPQYVAKNSFGCGAGYQTSSFSTAVCEKIPSAPPTAAVAKTGTPAIAKTATPAIAKTATPAPVATNINNINRVTPTPKTCFAGVFGIGSDCGSVCGSSGYTPSGVVSGTCNQPTPAPVAANVTPKTTTTTAPVATVTLPPTGTGVGAGVFLPLNNPVTVWAAQQIAKLFGITPTPTAATTRAPTSAATPTKAPSASGFSALVNSTSPTKAAAGTPTIAKATTPTPPVVKTTTPQPGTGMAMNLIYNSTTPPHTTVTTTPPTTTGATTPKTTAATTPKTTTTTAPSSGAGGGKPTRGPGCFSACHAEKGTATCDKECGTVGGYDPNAPHVVTDKQKSCAQDCQDGGKGRQVCDKACGITTPAPVAPAVYYNPCYSTCINTKESKKCDNECGTVNGTAPAVSKGSACYEDCRNVKGKGNAVCDQSCGTTNGVAPVMVSASGGGACAGGYGTGSVAIGPGDVTKQCGSDGKWKDCPGCLITEVPVYLQNKDAYKAKYVTDPAEVKIFDKEFDTCHTTSKDVSSCQQKAIDAITQSRLQIAYETYAKIDSTCTTPGGCQSQLKDALNAAKLSQPQLQQIQTAYAYDKVQSAYFEDIWKYDQCMASKAASCDPPKQPSDPNLTPQQILEIMAKSNTAIPAMNIVSSGDTKKITDACNALMLNASERRDGCGTIALAIQTLIGSLPVGVQQTVINAYQAVAQAAQNKLIDEQKAKQYATAVDILNSGTAAQIRDACRALLSSESIAERNDACGTDAVAKATLSDLVNGMAKTVPTAVISTVNAALAKVNAATLTISLEHGEFVKLPPGKATCDRSNNCVANDNGSAHSVSGATDAYALACPSSCGVIGAYSGQVNVGRGVARCSDDGRG